MKSIIAATMERVTVKVAAELMMAVNIILSFSFVISFLLTSCPEDERLKHPNEVDGPVSRRFFKRPARVHSYLIIVIFFYTDTIFGK